MKSIDLETIACSSTNCTNFPNVLLDINPGFIGAFCKNCASLLLERGFICRSNILCDLSEDEIELEQVEERPSTDSSVQNS
jgi:hypothetical protein